MGWLDNALELIRNSPLLAAAIAVIVTLFVGFVAGKLNKANADTLTRLGRTIYNLICSPEAQRQWKLFRDGGRKGIRLDLRPDLGNSNKLSVEIEGSDAKSFELVTYYGGTISDFTKELSRKEVKLLYKEAKRLYRQVEAEQADIQLNGFITQLTTAEDKLYKKEQ